MRTLYQTSKLVLIPEYYSKDLQVIIPVCFNRDLSRNGMHGVLIPTTGRQATANVKESLEWGTKIVGGVKPGVEGEHLGLPVFPSVKAV